MTPAVEFKSLETARCRIRSFAVDDLLAFTAYRAQPDVARFQSWSSYSYSDAQAFYTEQINKPFALQG